MRSHVSALLTVAAAAAVSSFAAVAAAAPPEAARPAPPEPASLPAPTHEAAWDIPGWFVVDGDDGLSKSEVADLGAELGVALVPTALADETNVMIGEAAPSVVARMIARLRGDGRVEAVEPLAWVQALGVPDDPLYGKQWHLDRIGMPSAWDYASGRGVTVAVVDTGIACEDHGPFKKGTDLNTTECVSGWNFVTKDEHANDDQGHGSHVAGTIAQSTNNGVGAAGVAFHAKLMPVKVLNGRGTGTTADVADGIRWAGEHGADVINLSLGGPRNAKILEDAVADARSRGAVVVAAAGNSGGAVGFPGATEGVIGVSATGPDDKIASFSSRGKEVDVAAPGVDVVQQTICNGGHGGCERFPGFSGTSMASPHVAGVAALLVSQGVTDIDAVEAALKGSARKVDDSEAGKRLYGAGILDAAGAVRDVWMKQATYRLVAFVGLALALVVAARKKAKDAKVTPGFLLAGLAAGPGLLFFAPLVASRTIAPIDALARPVGDLTLLVSPELHAWLPLANGLVPLALTALLFHVRAMRPALAGFATGTAAYLLAVPLLGQHGGPLGAAALAGWCVLNAAVCALVAKTNLAATT
jgi:serine protease